jgi:putative glycosyltransferase (TIGR04372 family)
MFLHKSRAAIYLGWLILWSNLSSVVGSLHRGPRATVRECRQAALRIWLAVHAGLMLRGKFRVTRVVKLCLASGVTRATLEQNLEAAVVLAERDIGSQQFERAIAILTPHIDAAGNHPKAAKCYGMRSLAHIWHGNYRETIADIKRCAELRPKFARGFYYLANLAQVYGGRGETEEARKAVAAQCGATVREDATEFLAKYLKLWVKPFLAHIPPGETVGVMFGAYHQAVGHAILDPFHFYNLFRHRFDHLVVVHPPLAGYSRPTSVMVSIMHQHLDQIEIRSRKAEAKLAYFPWQNLGELQAGNTTFLCLNYWALNSMAFRARRDPSHPMSQGRQYVGLPAKVVERAEVLCRRNRLEITRPIVVLHTRSHGYHRLRGQAYRNVDACNYIPAVRRLIELGYSVVRLGEKKMASLCPDVPELIELPSLSAYDPVLDAYFLQRCEFMISCQSGPCSLARAMGKPNLVVNAVYHYSMLPEYDEMFVFKHYRDVDGTVLSLEELLARGCHLFDRQSHFEAARVNLEDATADEILAATEEMLGGLGDINRVDTPHQAAFRELLMRFAGRPASHPLINRLSHYMGYALPEGRVSDAVCQMRPGYVIPRREAFTRVA